MSLYCSPPKFFKIIQNHELQNGELRVPKKFVEKYWEGIPNPVVISLPNGVQQDLYWVKRDGDIWFRKNWEKIAKFLKFGFLVYFKYMGGSCFELEILGLNCLEVDYSNIKFENQAQKYFEVSDESDDDDDDESEIHKQFQRTQNGNRKMNMDFDFDTTQETISSMNKKAKKDIKAETNVASTSHRRKSAESSCGNLKKRSFDLYEKVMRNFDSQHKDFFACILHKTYIERHVLAIPIEFGKTHLQRMEGRNVSLFVDKDRTWNVDLKLCTSNKQYKQFKLSGGWSKFRAHYNLKFGDVCVFILNKCKGTVSFQVVIFSLEKEMNTPYFEG